MKVDPIEKVIIKQNLKGSAGAGCGAIQRKNNIPEKRTTNAKALGGRVTVLRIVKMPVWLE